MMKKQQTSSLRFALFACLIIVTVVIGIIIVLNAPSLQNDCNGSSNIPPTLLECIKGDENEDASCDEAADYNDIPLPIAEEYSGKPTCCNIAQVIVDDTILPYRGVSLAGGEFRNTPGDDDAKRGEYLPFDNDATLFLYRGMNTFRIPITWEYFADTDGVIFTTGNYIERLDAVINGLVSVNASNASVIIEIHNYMRYNADDVSKNVENTDPNGADVINELRISAFANLWYNIANRYYAPKMMYGIMNEPHDVSFDVLNSVTIAAYRAIRQAEDDRHVTRHLVLISGNQYTGLHSWFDSNFEGKSNAANIVLLEELRLIDPLFAVEVHQYFDDDSSGRYLDNGGNCLPTINFTTRFDVYWQRFRNWTINNRVQVFLGEFGALDTPICRVNIRYLLDAFTLFAYSPSKGYGVIGWTVWAAGNSWGGDYILSLAPGGRANGLMWDNVTYQKYLVENGQFSPIETKTQALTIFNNGSRILHFEGGYLPFQFKGSPNILPGQIGYLYSNNAANTPKGEGGLVIKYYVTTNQSLLVGFGITPPDPLTQGTRYSYSFNKTNIVVLRNFSNGCGIQAFGEGSNRGESRCFVVSDGSVDIPTSASLGSDCPNVSGACLRDRYFANDATFILGNQTNGGHTVTFNNAAAVINFLLVDAPPNVFNETLVNPLFTSGGSFTAELLTAMMNVGFLQNQSNFTVLTFSFDCTEVNVNIVGGLTIIEVIYLANQVIANQIGNPYTLQDAFDLTVALAFFNNNFRKGGNIFPNCFICELHTVAPTKSPTLALPTTLTISPTIVPTNTPTRVPCDFCTFTQEDFGFRFGCTVEVQTVV